MLIWEKLCWITWVTSKFFKYYDIQSSNVLQKSEQSALFRQKAGHFTLLLSIAVYAIENLQYQLMSSTFEILVIEMVIRWYEIWRLHSGTIRKYFSAFEEKNARFYLGSGMCFAYLFSFFAVHNVCFLNGKNDDECMDVLITTIGLYHLPFFCLLKIKK